MSEYDIRPELNNKIGIRMSKCDIRPQIECQNRISNSKMLYLAQIQMTYRISTVEKQYSVRIRKSKWNFECQNSVFWPNLNVKIGLRMSKCVIQPESECQNRISNVKMRYSAPVRMSKHDFEYQNAIFGPN